MKTAVYLDDRQCRLFLLLEKAGTATIANGSVEVFFDEKGEPTKVKTTQYHELSTPRVADTLQVVV